MPALARFAALAFALGIPAAHAQLASVNVVTLTAPFEASGGVAVGPDGQVYAANFGQALNNADGTVLYRVGLDGAVTPHATGFAGASGNVVAPDGTLFQSNIAGSRISRVAPDGTVTTYASEGIANPVGVTLDADGNVYNTNCANPGWISRTTPDGSTTRFAESPLMSCPNGLTIGPDGTLYTANFNDGRVLRISTAGEVSLLATVNDQRGNGHLTYANDRLYVCNWSGRVYELLLDGSFRVLAGTGTLGADDGPGDRATFFRPNGIAPSVTGDTLFLNQTSEFVPMPQLYPNVVRMITGVLSTVSSSAAPVQNGGIGLAPSSPNPFSGVTTIAYELDTPMDASLRVYDTLGRTVRTLVDGLLPAGPHEAHWDGHDASGRRVAPGVYLYTLRTDALTETRRVTLVR